MNPFCDFLCFLWPSPFAVIRVIRGQNLPNNSTTIN